MRTSTSPPAALKGSLLADQVAITDNASPAGATLGMTLGADDTDPTAS